MVGFSPSTLPCALPNKNQVMSGKVASTFFTFQKLINKRKIEDI